MSRRRMRSPKNNAETTETTTTCRAVMMVTFAMVVSCTATMNRPVTAPNERPPHNECLMPARVTGVRRTASTVTITTAYSRNR